MDKIVVMNILESDNSICRPRVSELTPTKSYSDERFVD